MLVAKVDGVLVFDRSPGLNNCLNAMLVSNLHTIRKREEGIGSHHGSLGSFAFGDARYGVGASGAIFGLFGILLIATRTHNPALDRASRNFVAQLGTLIMINVIFGIIAAGYIDNFAHAGGFIAGALLGLAFVPGKVATIRSMWQTGAGGATVTGFIGSPAGRMAAILVLVGLLAAAAAIGLGRW